MKRLMLLALMMLLALPCAAEEFYTEMPALLSFTQEMHSETVAQDIFIRRTYPDTENDRIDEEMRALIDDMAEKSRPVLPLERVTIPSYLDVGANISRSGKSLLSFLTVAEVSREKKQLSVDFDARVYDTATGERVQLSDLFEGDAAYAVLGDALRNTLENAFPAIEADKAVIDALCAPEAIAKTPFTLGAARLTLIVRADAVYPGKNTLLHANVGYSALRGYMNEYGLKQTDNSRFQMLALTFDDGPARGVTRAVLDALRDYGASATFFVVGERFGNNHDMLCREQDANHSIQSHTYAHKYPNELAKGEAERDRERFAAELGEITGVAPVMMRAPGGHASYYAKREIGYPLIQWTFAGGDSGNPHIDKIAWKVIESADDGEIALLHDLNGGSPTYTRRALDALTKKGFLFVTVEELFEDAGSKMLDNVIYYSPTDVREK